MKQADPLNLVRIQLLPIRRQPDPDRWQWTFRLQLDLDVWSRFVT
jgi:hypothetical protein